MGALSDSSEKLNDTQMIELSGKIMVLAVILFFFVLVFFFCHRLYVQVLWHRREQNTPTVAAATATTRRRRRRRLDFAAGHDEILLVPCRRFGLDPRVLRSIPVVKFDPNEFEDGLECAVCLCEVSEGETARILPRCNHGFHVDCIDMWLHSHSTCPLCRNSVSIQRKSNSYEQSTVEDTIPSPLVAGNSTLAPNSPTNLLFWGEEARVRRFDPCMEDDRLDRPTSESATLSSQSPSPSSPMALTGNEAEGMVVIDIPRRID